MTDAALSSPATAAGSAAAAPPTGAATGAVSWVLRAEGAAALAAGCIAYSLLGQSWWMFALLFLLPDLSMLGYLVNRRLGAIAYNAGHTYLAPAALAALGWALGADLLFAIAAIWVAHIGFDRLLGYGLKYETAFGATHLGWAIKPKA